MKEKNKTKKELISELMELRQRVAELETSEAKRKLAQEDLRSSEPQYRMMIDSMGDAIHMIDGNLRIILFNKSFMKWNEELGLETDVIGKAIHKVFPFLPQEVYEEYHRVFKTGQLLITEECTQIGGKEFITQTRKIPVFGNGKVTRVITVIRDITEQQRSEETLSDSERRYRDLFENANDIIYTHDLEGNITSANRAALSTFGYSLEEALKTNIAQLVDQEYLPLAWENTKRKLDTGKPTAPYELLCHSRYGKEIWLEVNTRLIKEDGRPVAVEGIGRDVTERKKAEQELRESEEFNFALFHYNPIETVVVDREGRVIRSNMAKRQSGDRLPNIGDLMYKDYAGKHDTDMFSELMECIGSGETKSFPELRYNDRFLFITIAPFPKGAIITSKDITEYKHAKEALQKSEEKYRTIFETTPAATLIIEEDTTISMVNTEFEKLFRYSKEETEGKKSWTELVKEDSLEMTEEYHRLRRIDPDSAPKNYECQVINKQGDVKDVFLTVAMIPGTKKSVASALDITERKQLGEQLLHAQKMEAVGRLAGGVAHDFNNLLTVINGYAELARAKLHKENPLYNYVETIKRAGEKAANLTRQLLAFSRHQIVKPQVIDLNSVTLDMDKMLRRLIGEDIELVIIPSKDLGSVKADPGQIEQALINLIVNSRDAMPDGGKITIETANVDLEEVHSSSHDSIEPRCYVMISVSDTGIGMSDEVKSHLFEPFFTTKEVDKGTGLGLATVYGIVKQSEGYISVDSEEGKGTIFRIYLPCIEETADSSIDRDEKGYLPRGDETVLLVEDEPNVREFVSKILEDQGYTVLEASNGIEALNIAREHDGYIHLLLTDIVMPKIGGQQLAEAVRGSRPKIKVFYVSGYTDESIIRQELVDSKTGFLQKPFTVSSLIRKTREILDKEF